MIGLINGSVFSKMDNCLTSMIKIGGITILERQIRIMRKTGVSEIVIIPGADIDVIRKAIKEISFKDVKISISQITRAGFLQSFVLHQGGNDIPVLYFDGCSIFDDRLPERFVGLKKQRAAMIPEEILLKEELDRGITIQSGNKKFKFVGIASVSLKTLLSIKMNVSDNISADIVKKIIDDSDSPILDISTLSTYNYDMRRDQSYMWMYIESYADNRIAKKELLDRSQKSVLDWPAWFIHRPIEKWIVYHICEWPVTPNQITLINIIVAFAATYFFAAGMFLPAMILAVATGIIDGLDGKQARVKMMMSKIGRLEEVSDRIYEYSWYLAIAYHLASIGFGNFPYMLFGILFILHAVDIAVCALFKFKKGVQIDDAGQMERNFRWIGSRRNTNIWSFIPFVLFGAVYEGYLFLVGYYALTIAFKVWRTAFHFIRKDTNDICCG